jgi:hypothetical protein
VGFSVLVVHCLLSFLELWIEAVSGSTSEVTGLGWGAFLFSILAIVGAIVVKINPKIGGTLMLISGISGLISISMFYVLATVFLVIAGLMGIFRLKGGFSSSGGLQKQLSPFPGEGFNIGSEGLQEFYFL